MQVTKNPLLSIDVVAGDDGKGICLVPKGPLAAPARPVIDRINRLFKDEKPIHSSPDRFIFSTWIPPAPGEAFNRMIFAQAASLLRRPVPDQFSIAIIRGCPNSCIHCAAPSRTGDVLSSDVIRRAIIEAMDLGSYIITFDGGEPMLRRDLPSLVSAVDSRAISTSFTSGFGLCEDLAAMLKRNGLYAVRVSIDSPYPSEHDRVRGREGAFDDAITGIKNALSAGLLTDMFMVVSPGNIDSLEDAYSLACDLGVHELSLYEIVAVGRWADHFDEILTPDDVCRLERFQVEKNRVKGPRVTAFPYLMGERMFGCFSGRRWIHIDASGNALPCAYVPLEFGNIKDSSLEAIWKEMSSYRHFHGRSFCKMKDPAFRAAHPQMFRD